MMTFRHLTFCHNGTVQTPDIVILAAGLGSRLGRPIPKCLTPLAGGTTIMEQQVAAVRQVFGTDARVTAVVGFKFELVMEEFPDLTYVYNEVVRPHQHRQEPAEGAPAERAGWRVVAQRGPGVRARGHAPCAVSHGGADVVHLCEHRRGR